MPSAEKAYLFRHAVMRDAAYQLQMPTERATLHHLCIDILLEVIPGASEVLAEQMVKHCERSLETELEPAEHTRINELLLQCLDNWAKRARSNFSHLEARKIFERLASNPATDPALRAESLRNAGVEDWFLGNLKRADERLAKALQAARTAGSMAVEAATLANLSVTATMLGRPLDGIQLATEGLAAARRSQDQFAQIAAMSNLGNAYLQSSQMESAVKAFSKAYRLARRFKDHRRAIAILMNIGLALHHSGHHNEAERYYLQTLENLEVEDKKTRATTLGNLATLMNDSGRLEQSISTYEACLKLCEEIGDSRSLAAFLVSYANPLRDVGRVNDSLQAANMCIRMARETGEPRSIAMGLCGRGYSLVLLGQNEEGEISLADGISLLHEIRQKELESSYRRVLAEHYLNEGEFGPAENELRLALKAARELGHAGMVVESLAALGKLSLLTGNAAGANKIRTELEKVVRDEQVPPNARNQAVAYSIRHDLTLHPDSGVDELLRRLNDFQEMPAQTKHVAGANTVATLQELLDTARESDSRTTRIFRGHLAKELKEKMRLALLRSASAVETRVLQAAGA